MGIDYYLVDRNKKIFYELDKGGWYALNAGLDYLVNQELLTLHILDHCFYKESYNNEDWKDITKYITNRIVPDLFKYFGDSKPEHLSVINDLGDDLVIMRVKNYVCVGSRCYDKDTNDYKDNIKNLNRHLNGDPINKKRYNPNNYKQYPEFDKY